MSKATAAIVSLLSVACVFVFAHWVLALLVANGGVSALSLVLIFVLTIAGMDSKRSGRLVRRFLRYGAPALLVLLGPALLWASFGTAFRGVVTTLNTGSITLGSSADVAVDTMGNVYIADPSNNQIVEVAADGTASVLAFPGLSPALNSPQALAVDGSGTLYVADSNNARVVKLAGGVASVIATASLLSNPDGVAVDAAGNLYIADATNNDIVEVPAGGAAAVLSISGLSPVLSQPGHLAVDAAGNLYIADAGNNRIAVVAPGGAGTVFSITGGLTLNGPKGVAVDTLGTVYIADTSNSRIVTVNTAGTVQLVYTDTTVLSLPRGVGVSVGGAIYIADSGNSQIVEVQPAAVGFGHLPNGTVSGTTLTLPFSVANGVVLSSVQILTLGTPSLDFTANLGAGCGFATSNGGGCAPLCVAGTTGTQLCTVDITFLPTAPGLRRGAIVFFDSSVPPAPVVTVPLYGTSDAPLAALNPAIGSVIGTGGVTLPGPFQVALDGAGNMYVAEDENGSVTRIPAGGGAATVVALGTPGGSSPIEVTGVAIDGAGNLFISDHENSRILVVTPTGVVSILSITGLSPVLGFPVALAFDGAGNLYVSDYTRSRVIRVSSLVVAGSTSSGRGMVIGTGAFTFGGASLTGTTVDAQGNIYIAARTQNSSSIIKVTPAGAASALSLPGIVPAISNPQGVGVDAMGNIYVVDTGNSRIVRLTTAGVASALSIRGLPAPSTLSSLGFGVTLDPSGNLYIPDFLNNRIVFVNVAASSLSFASTKVGMNSAAQTVTAVDLGNLPLAFAVDPLYTADFSQPAGSTNQCFASTPLASGTACNVSVQFSPQSIGLISAGIVLTDNSLNLTSTTQNIAVSGTGLVAGDTTATVVSTNPTSAIAGQAITVTAIVTDTAAGHTATIPTGGVTFTDTVGSTVLSLNGGAAVTVDGTGKAILTGATLSGAGLHTITANYAGVTNTFLASSNTTTIPVTVPPPPTLTTLSITPGVSVAAGSVVTLTASVLANSVPVMQGTVLFCDATAAYCQGSALFGTAQLTGAGTASIKLTPGVGVYSITAEFQSTNSVLSSASAPQALTVTANASYPSITTLAVSGSAGDYTLTSTTSAFGKSALSGTTSFLDTSSGNAVVGTATFNPATLGFGFIPAAGSPLAEPNFPLTTVTGDFNHDGILDMALIDSEQPTVSILLGIGDGTFHPAVTYALNDYGYGIAVGDFNGDGNLDLVAGSSGTTVSVLLGNGDGTFQAETAYTVGSYPASVVVGDFNNDGFQDVAVANSTNGNNSSTISILLGNGDGTFQAQVQYAAGTYPFWLVTGDFNGDGKTDLAVSSGGSTRTVSVLLGNGDGSFQSPVSYVIGATADYLVAVDLNQDGKPDLVTANETNSTISVFLNNGDGTFKAPVAYAAGTDPADIAVGDFNGDGKVDLAVSNFDTTISVLSGNGDGTFQTQTTWTVGSGSWGIAAGDFNGDGLTDIAVANYDDGTVSILLSEQSETATATAVSVAGIGAHDVLSSYPGDANRQLSLSSTVALTGTVSQTVTTTTTLTASPNPLFDGQPATLTATVTPAPTGSPAGIISFYSGATLLGTATLNASGVATLTISTLVVGDDSLTAVYPGNAGFAASTSLTVSETVTTAFTVTGPDTPVTVGPGGSATFDLTVPPLGGAFDSLVTLSATGLPPGATATFTPIAVTPGTDGAPTVLTVQLATLVAGTPLSDSPANHRGLPVTGLSLAFGLFGVVLGRKRIPRRLLLTLALTGLGVTVSLLAGCGGGFANTPVTPPGNYTITVTGTSGSFQASTTVTLVVTK